MKRAWWSTVLVAILAATAAALVLVTGATARVAAFSGTYQGIYTAVNPEVEAGTWRITVDNSGIITGWVHSNVYNRNYGLRGRVTAKGEMKMGIGSISTGATFAGRVDKKGRVTGTWVNKTLGSKYRGTFKGAKLK